MKIYPPLTNSLQIFYDVPMEEKKTLKEELQGLTGNKRRYVLMRIADVDVGTAMKLNKVTQGQYNTWMRCTDGVLPAISRRVDELVSEHKQEAIQLLRRDNQLTAILLEEKILNKIGEELDSGEYVLVKTNLARDVYTKLVSDLDYKPTTPALTWNQRIGQFFQEAPPEPLTITQEPVEVLDNREVPNAQLSEGHPEEGEPDSGETP